MVTVTCPACMYARAYERTLLNLLVYVLASAKERKKENSHDSHHGQVADREHGR